MIDEMETNEMNHQDMNDDDDHKKQLKEFENLLLDF